MMVKTYFSRSKKGFHFWRQIIFGVTEILQSREKRRSEHGSIYEVIHKPTKHKAGFFVIFIYLNQIINRGKISVIHFIFMLT